MQHQAERNCLVRPHHHLRSADPDALRISRGVRLQLAADDQTDVGPAPVRIEQKTVSARERVDASVETVDEFLVRRRIPERLAGDRLDDSKRVLDAVRELASSNCCCLSQALRSVMSRVLSNTRRRPSTTDKSSWPSTQRVRPSLVTC